jgi:hypothetical protein
MVQLSRNRLQFSLHNVVVYSSILYVDGQFFYVRQIIC